jgi:cation transport regulator ChaC
LRAYFAYGANMVLAAMALRCPKARLAGPAVLMDHRFAIIRGGHGTVLRRRGASVHGVLWRLARSDEAALDLYEEVAAGLYRREWRAVESGGRRVAALVYVATATAPGRPRASYLAGMIAAGRAYGFPADYLTALEAIARTASGESPLSLSARKLGA